MPLLCDFAEQREATNGALKWSKRRCHKLRAHQLREPQKYLQQQGSQLSHDKMRRQRRTVNACKCSQETRDRRHDMTLLVRCVHFGCVLFF